jgi:hypothetical protein
LFDVFGGVPRELIGENAMVIPPPLGIRLIENTTDAPDAPWAKRDCLT